MSDVVPGRPARPGGDMTVSSHLRLALRPHGLRARPRTELRAVTRPEAASEAVGEAAPIPVQGSKGSPLNNASANHRTEILVGNTIWDASHLQEKEREDVNQNLSLKYLLYILFYIK